MGGVCEVGSSGLPGCTGGGYTPCDAYDAGYRCYNSAIVMVCDSQWGASVWAAGVCQDINPGSVCMAGVGCGP